MPDGRRLGEGIHELVAGTLSRCQARYRSYCSRVFQTSTTTTLSASSQFRSVSTLVQPSWARVSGRIDLKNAIKSPLVPGFALTSTCRVTNQCET